MDVIAAVLDQAEAALRSVNLVVIGQFIVFVQLSNTILQTQGYVIFSIPHLI